MQCPRCNSRLRKLVNLTVDVDSNVNRIDKTELRDKNTEILAADFIKATYYCPKPGCGYVKRPV